MRVRMCVHLSKAYGTQLALSIVVPLWQQRRSAGSGGAPAGMEPVSWLWSRRSTSRAVRPASSHCCGMLPLHRVKDVCGGGGGGDGNTWQLHAPAAFQGW